MTKIISNKSNVDLDYPICRPSLDLDFTQEVLDPRITFSRGSIGTRVNRNRLIETVSTNQPRFDYDPVTGECKGLLIEESRTNSLLRSRELATSPWAIFNGGGFSVSNNVTISPDGTSNASQMNSTSYTDGDSVYQDVFASGTSTYTLSVFVKGGTRNTIALAGFFIGNSAQAFSFGFNPLTGLITETGGGSNHTVVLYPNGWYRIYFTVTGTNALNTVLRFQVYTTGTGITYLWGAQVEQGSFPTSYIPTVASTVTRSADLADMTGTNFSSWYNQTEGTLYASLNNITTRSSLTFDRLVALVGTDANRDVISICTQTAAGGGAQNKFLAGISYSPDGSYVIDTFVGAVSGGGGPDRIGKAIIAYKKDNFAFTVNGITPLRDIGGDIPVCNRLLIFGSARYQPAPSGYIKRLTYYPRALKPNQLQLLTQ